MRFLIPALLISVHLPAYAADNEEILQNSQALLEKARKMDEQRRTLNAYAAYPAEPQKPTAPPEDPKAPDLKTPEDVLKAVKPEPKNTKE